MTNPFARQVACAFTTVLLLAGCTTSAPRKPQSIPNSNTDPCAMRLHEFCAPLLLYFATNHTLPPNVESLNITTEEFVCPVSHKPYIYNPNGLPAPDPGARLIVYDPEPTHQGRRWAISVMEPHGDAPLIAKVIAIPESRFPRAH